MPRWLFIAIGAGLVLLAGNAAASAGAVGPSRPREDDDGASNATGYVNGQPVSLYLVTIDSAGHQLRADAADAFFAMRDAAARDGVSLVVESAFRSMAEQQYLWGCYQSGTCNGGNLAARPGYSNHQGGVAVDFVTASGTNAAYRWLMQNATRFGWRCCMAAGEPWHFEYGG